METNEVDNSILFEFLKTNLNLFYLFWNNEKKIYQFFFLLGNESNITMAHFGKCKEQCAKYIVVFLSKIFFQHIHFYKYYWTKANLINICSIPYLRLVQIRSHYCTVGDFLTLCTALCICTYFNRKINGFKK